MLAEDYLDKVLETLLQVKKTQAASIHAAATLVATSIQSGGVLYAFGASHTSMIAQELVYRAGGLILANPLFAPGLSLDVTPVPMTSEIERLEGYGTLLVRNSRISEKDVVIVASISGRNAVPIEVAMEAKKRGAKVIILTSLQYSQSVTSRHSSGKRLFELEADVILDNCGPPGDAVMDIPGVKVKTGPTSTIIGCALVNAIVVEAIGILAKAGMDVPVFLSGNLDGGDQHNRYYMEKYKDKLTYL